MSPTLAFLMTQPGYRVIAHCDQCGNDRSFDPLDLATAHGEDTRVDQLKFRCTGWFKNPTCRARVRRGSRRRKWDCGTTDGRISGMSEVGYVQVVEPPPVFCPKCRIQTNRNYGQTCPNTPCPSGLSPFTGRLGPDGQPADT